MSELKISDGSAIIKNKILLNNISLEMFNLQKSIYALNIKLFEINIVVANKKQDHIKELNKYYEQQLNEFCEFTDNECKYIIEDINKLDENYEANQISVNKSKLEEKLKDLTAKYYHIMTLIPNEKMITNYKIKYKNNNSSCSQEFNNDYNDYNE
jgi:hypothetical protein